MVFHCLFPWFFMVVPSLFCGKQVWSSMAGRGLGGSFRDGHMNRGPGSQVTPLTALSRPELLRVSLGSLGFVNLGSTLFVRIAKTLACIFFSFWRLGGMNLLTVKLAECSEVDGYRLTNARNVDPIFINPCLLIGGVPGFSGESSVGFINLGSTLFEARLPSLFVDPTCCFSVVSFGVLVRSSEQGVPGCMPSHMTQPAVSFQRGAPSLWKIQSMRLAGTAFRTPQTLPLPSKLLATITLLRHRCL